MCLDITAIIGRDRPRNLVYGQAWSAVGPISMALAGRQIVSLTISRDADAALTRSHCAGVPRRDDELVRRKTALLDEYLRYRAAADLEILLIGTAFQHAVWDALLDIPRGETRSYGQIAADIGKPGAARAVGAACAANPVALLIPCHRAVGAKGKLTGFSAGDGISTKAALLSMEIGQPDLLTSAA